MSDPAFEEQPVSLQCKTCETSENVGVVADLRQIGLAKAKCPTCGEVRIAVTDGAYLFLDPPGEVENGAHP